MKYRVMESNGNYSLQRNLEVRWSSWNTIATGTKEYMIEEGKRLRDEYHNKQPKIVWGGY